MLKTESEESELCDITQNQPMELTTNSSMDHHRPPDFHFNSLPPDHPLSLLPHHRGRQVKKIKKIIRQKFTLLLEIIRYTHAESFC